MGGKWNGGRNWIVIYCALRLLPRNRNPIIRKSSARRYGDDHIMRDELLYNDFLWPRGLREWSMGLGRVRLVIVCHP